MVHTELKGKTVHGVLQGSLEAQPGMCVDSDFTERFSFCGQVELRR